MLIENISVELKREYVADIVKTVVAFANTEGGTVYIGIANDGSVTGVENADETMLKVSNAVRDSIKPDVTLFAEYLPEKIDDKIIIKVVVQKGTASPYYLGRKGIRPEGVYVRQGASTVPATETAILQMIKETDGGSYEEVRALNQDLTFTETARVFEERGVAFGNAQQKTLALINDSGIYTNLALLLSDQCVHTIKLAVYEGTVKAQFRDRREFGGSLLKQLNDAYEYIDRYNNLRARINGLHRTDRRDYPVEALREALLNSLVHRDYSFRDSTLISIFDDRIEFVTIGGLVRGITFEDMMLGVSVARNRNLANVFYRLSLIEAYGMGIPQIMRSYEAYAVNPKIETSDHAFKITLPNTKQTKEEAGLNDNESIILQMFDTQTAITRNEVEEKLGVSQAMAGRILKELMEKKRIIRVGGGRNTRYERA